MVKLKPHFHKTAAFALAAASLLAALALPASAATTSSSTASTDTGTGTVAGNVEIDGTIEPQTLDVSFPTTVTYTINPNSTPTFTADELDVTNNGTSKIDVTVASLASTSGGSLEFTDVSPDTYTDTEWDNLSLADSKKYIALGVNIADSDGWDSGYNTSTDYAASDAAVDFGQLDSGKTGTFGFTAKHGLAFDQTYTAKHALAFEFSLA